MRDISFVSGDSESLILETLDGEKLRLNVDESVRQAVRKSPQSASGNNLSPREIQDAIRSGNTVEELAISSGDSAEFIRRFAAPVLEELAHMVASALAVRVEISPDRYNEARHQEFGELISERLSNTGASGLTWQASRLNPSTWTITASFETPAGPGFATWTYEPRHVVLSPENETAVNLSNTATLGDSVIPKLSSVQPSAIGSTTAAPVEESKVTDLLDAFKQRREAAAASDTQEDEPEFVAETITEVSEVDLQEEQKSEAPKKGRAPMPSWDEIVFGSKSED